MIAVVTAEPDRGKLVYSPRPFSLRRQLLPCERAQCHPSCNGWFVVENYFANAVWNISMPQVERCDECAVFDSDESVIEHIFTCARCSEHYKKWTGVL